MRWANSETDPTARVPTAPSKGSRMAASRLVSALRTSSLPAVGRPPHRRRAATRLAVVAASAALLGALLPTPSVLAAAPSATAIAAGGNHTCAVLTGGSVDCWGYNGWGQLGNGTTTNSSTPVAVSGITSATAIAAGGAHTCAVVGSGSVECWGYNGDGELGNGTTTQSSTPVTVSGITSATAIAAGWNFTCALLADTTVRCWGGYSYGQLGGGYTQLDAVVGLSGVTAIAAGGYHACALLASGSVYCWGDNGSGQLGNCCYAMSSTPVVAAVSSYGSALTAIAAGHDHTCAVLADTTVDCWGANGDGQLGYGTWRDGGHYPVPVSGLSGVRTIAAGGYHTCALLSGGGVTCWGDNSAGELGNGTTTQSTTPVAVSGLTTATAIAAGGNHTCALLTGGSVDCWGDNGYGQLGNGTTTNSSTPVVVSGLGGAKTVPTVTYVTGLTSSSTLGANVDLYGKPLTVKAKLVTDIPTYPTPVPGETLTFDLGYPPAIDTCTAQTDASGVASCVITPTQPSSPAVSPVPLKATFAGDATYAASADWSLVNLSNPKYVALGDSYSSGEGAVAGGVTTTHPNPSFEWGTDVWTSSTSVTDVCHRSVYAYSAVLAATFQQLDPTLHLERTSFVACSGARLQDFWNRGTEGGVSEDPQLQALSTTPDLSTATPDPTIALVTFTIGGNDAHFSDLLSACVVGPLHWFDSTICSKTGIVWYLGVGTDALTDPSHGLVSTIQQIHTLAPNAAILVGGYPHIFTDSPGYCAVGSVFHTPLSVTQNTMSLLNGAVDTYDATIARLVTAASSANAHFVDPRSTFSASGGHGVCAAGTPWINALLLGGPTDLKSPDPSNWSFHPNTHGASAYATLFKIAAQQYMTIGK
jgi:alpha-tubulin suppressor-like RCC1 family protein